MVTRSEVYGAKSGTYFEYPEMISGAQNSLHCPAEFHDKLLTKISACVGIGIYSLQLTYSDGCVSPLLGKREVNTDTEILPGTISTIRIQHFNENYVQTLMMLNPNRDTLAKLECKGGKGQVEECQISENQTVIGIFGYLDKK